MTSVVPTAAGAFMRPAFGATLPDRGAGLAGGSMPKAPAGAAGLTAQQRERRERDERERHDREGEEAWAQLAEEQREEVNEAVRILKSVSYEPCASTNAQATVWTL